MRDARRRRHLGMRLFALPRAKWYNCGQCGLAVNGRRWSNDYGSCRRSDQECIAVRISQSMEFRRKPHWGALCSEHSAYQPAKGQKRNEGIAGYDDPYSCESLCGLCKVTLCRTSKVLVVKGRSAKQSADLTTA